MLTKLAQWNPFKNLGHLQNALNRVFERFFRQRQEASEDQIWFPAVDLAETATAFVVCAELPGMTQQDVELTIQDNVLLLQGEKKRPKKARHEMCYWAERQFGHFTEMFTLPAAVLPDQVKAIFSAGILIITLPKMVSAQTRRIAITT
jgi:HSP20 family protein